MSARPSSNGAIPPHDLDAEAAVLSSVMLDDEALARVDFLAPEHFYAEAHRRVFEACRELASKRQPVDVVQVATCLRSRGRLAQVGGSKYLAEILNSAPRVANVAAYAQTVQQKARVREAIATHQRLAAEGYVETVDPQRWLDASVAELRRHADGGAERARESAPAPILGWPDIAKPMPDPTYLVRELGMVDGGGSPHIVAGYGFSGKTLALQSLALSLAAARPIWGAFSCRDVRRVVHVDLEQGDRLTRRRYQRLALAMGVNEREIGDRLELVVLPKIRLTPHDRDAWLRLMTDRDLVIVDSLRAAAPGVDENSSAMREPLDFLLSLSEQTGCRGTVVVHARKPGEKDGQNGAKFSIRGSSAIFDASDGAYVFAGAKGEPVNVSCERVRSHGDPCEDFALVIADVQVGEDPRAGVRVDVRGAELVQQAKEASVRVQRETRARIDAETMRKVLASYPGLGKRELLSAMAREGIGNRQRVDEALHHLGATVEFREEMRGRVRVMTHFLRG